MSSTGEAAFKTGQNDSNNNLMMNPDMQNAPDTERKGYEAGFNKAEEEKNTRKSN